MTHRHTHKFLSAGITGLALLTAATAAQADTTWTAGSIIVMPTTLTVHGTLTVEPGVLVHFGPDVRLVIAGDGTLIVNGTAEEPAQFVSFNPTARWEGLQFMPGSQGTVEHLEIKQADVCGITINNASPLIAHSRISDVRGGGLGQDACGIHVSGNNALPTIQWNTIELIQGSSGASGSAGPAGTTGAVGECFVGGKIEGTGCPGTSGGPGTAGGLGGSAVGILIELGARPAISSNVIRAMTGGGGGAGGNGGSGGSGGDGVDSSSVGGYGGDGGNGGHGGVGGAGGSAVGIHVLQPASVPTQILNNQIQVIQGGSAGNGGQGGLGGAGGDAGDGLPWFPCIAGVGGHGGEGGNGGQAGAGGQGGFAAAFRVGDLSAPLVIAHHTILGVERGAGGQSGSPGVGGDGGEGGAGIDSLCFTGDPGPDGSDGSDGPMSPGGVAGEASGLRVDGSASVRLQNNIIDLGDSPAGAFGAVTEGSGATISSNHNCYWNAAKVGIGQVSIGPGDFEADPLFVNSAGRDGRIGTDDDDLRLLAASPCIDAGAHDLVLQYHRNAAAWKSAAAGWSGHAFDQFLPGIAGGTGCLSGATATSVLSISGGTMKVSGFTTGGAPRCAINDSSTSPAVSDGALLPGAAILRLEFTPPIRSFYSYYGSLAVGEIGRMRLFTGATEVAVLDSLPSPSAVPAVGHGFASSNLIDRIEVTVTDTASLLGAFTGILAGDPSLGTVTIPGYAGPTGATVQMDFGYDFAPSAVIGGLLSYLGGEDFDGHPRVLDGDGDGDAIVDIGAYEFVAAPPCPADLDHNGVVNGLDLALFLGAWTGSISYAPCPPYAPADLNHDCKINGLDLALLLGAWGPCP